MEERGILTLIKFPSKRFRSHDNLQQWRH